MKRKKPHHNARHLGNLTRKRKKAAGAQGNRAGRFVWVESAVRPARLP